MDFKSGQEMNQLYLSLAIGTNYASADGFDNFCFNGLKYTTNTAEQWLVTQSVFSQCVLTWSKQFYVYSYFLSE